MLAYVNRFKMEAKWLPSEEANSPMVASLFLRNVQSNISDPCCLQFQPGNCTMIQLYQGAQEIQKRFDWKGTRRSDITGRQKNPETPAGAIGKVAMTKITAPSFAIFAIATPMAPEIVDLRADEPTVKAVEPDPPNCPGSSVLLLLPQIWQYLPSKMPGIRTEVCRLPEPTWTSWAKRERCLPASPQLQSADRGIGGLKI
ncbi:hypothetical protein R1flu_006963 [Riccia fluitans]|uniref:Uncharacterized protein n=1 Tax=Riccia fluitans TaxID=41844 RepID=A0ABD1Z078_9MARC